MRILYVCNRLWPFTLHRLPLAAAARDDGWDVHVAGPDEPAEVERLLAQRLVFHPIASAEGRLDPFALRRAVGDLAGLYDRLAPDIVHAVPLPAILSAGLAARRRPVPAFVGSITGMGYLFTDGAGLLKRAFFRLLAVPLLRRALAQPCRVVIVQNRDDHDALRSLRLFSDTPLRALDNPALAINPIRLIRGSGVDVLRFPFTPEPPVDPAEGPEILLTARFLRDKGVIEFVEAAERLAARGVKARCTLLGWADPFNPEAIPERLLDAWRARGVVRIEPALPSADMPARWARCHVACLPSYREGLSKSLLEAMATGRALVTTDVPGCRDLVRPGANGWRVPPRDAAALADALAEAVSDPARRVAFGREGRRLAEMEFSLSRILGEILGLYREYAGFGLEVVRRPSGCVKN